MNQDLLQTSFLAINLSLDEVLRALLLAAVLGFGISGLYRLSQRSQVTSIALQRSLVVLPMISAMVMMVIGNNLARAFSLVGALSIIRFRTRLRTSWDISFVFLSLAAGIGCGVFAWHVALAGTSVIALTIIALQVLPTGVPRGEIHLLRCDVASYEGIEAKVSAVLDRHLSRRSLDEAHAQRFGESFSYRYRVMLRPGSMIEDLIRELSEVEGVERVILTSREETDEGGD